MKSFWYISLIFIYALFINPYRASGQWPSSDVYLSHVKWNQKDILSGKPIFLNTFNPNGYNNQPGFIDYNTIYITVGMDTTGTDIYHLDLSKSEYFPFTKTTNISEFSALITPDQKQTSVIRIEEDRKTQTLWAYPNDRSGFGKNLLPSITNAGYHAWLSDHKVALFLVDSLHKLAIADIKTGSVNVLQDDIGRCLRSKNGYLFFTQKNAAGEYKVKRYQIAEQTIENVFTLPKGVEDFDVLANGNLIYGQGGKLFVFQQKPIETTMEVGNLEKFGINNIKRLVAERDRIIVVNQK